MIIAIAAAQKRVRRPITSAAPPKRLSDDDEGRDECGDSHASHELDRAVPSAAAEVPELLEPVGADDDTDGNAHEEKGPRIGGAQ